MSFVIAAREEPIHVSRHASVLMLRGMPLRPSDLFFATIVSPESRIATSLQVRGISSSMFFLSFCGPCSLNVQFPRTHHGNSYEHPIHMVELKNSLRNVRHGMLHNTVITQEENLRKTLEPERPGICPKSQKRLQLFF